MGISLCHSSQVTRSMNILWVSCLLVLSPTQGEVSNQLVEQLIEDMNVKIEEIQVKNQEMAVKIQEMEAKNQEIEAKTEEVTKENTSLRTRVEELTKQEE